MTHAEFREVMTFIAATPGKVAAVAEALAGRDLRWKPSESDFSVLENLCHLRDLEREGYMVRIERLLTEEAPDLAGFDGAAVARGRNYNAQDPLSALEAFTEARKENVERVRETGSSDLGRSGTFMGTDPITLGGVLTMMREHDEEHLKELAALRERLEKAAS